MQRIEKVKLRRGRNCRIIIRALKVDGTTYLRHADHERRKQQLRNGCEPRKGEKIIGKPCEFQSGVNVSPGRFEKAARDVREYRRIIATGGCQRGNNSQSYFEHMIDLVIHTERQTTKRLISELKADIIVS